MLYDAHTNIRNRGAYFPLGVMSQTAFRGEFAEHGFWQKTEGMLVIESPEGEIAGHVEFFRPGSYWDAFELSYELYADQYAGRGFVTEAVQLRVDYLFGAVGAAGDNAAMESFFGPLQKNVLNRRSWATRQKAVDRDRDLDRADLRPATGLARPIDPHRVRDHHDHASHPGRVTQPVT